MFSIQAPTLVLAGEKDSIKRAPTHAIGAHVSHGQATILPGLTHYAPQENPTLFNKPVLDLVLVQPPLAPAPAK
ncbi:alpha/beta fold hydrolase [Hymenobacter volaticus]|uniref:Alpha/beta hydrolase n=1 Tax=Hymenobacter volaticus TaxID=2932254 RepID=A0ABY4GDU7_9BACT|nr:alpha/beta hydrolase [Hymenobacter volaticus]UOQ69103.1 alpha/beta hydrolase [Hymenobacter volaticus]